MLGWRIKEKGRSRTPRGRRAYAIGDIHGRLDLLDQLLYPAVPPLPGDSAIRSISLSYPERDVDALGWRLNWMIVFFALTLIFAFALRGPLGVTI